MLPHDAACKLLFSFPAMVRNLLAGFFPREWVEELDLSTLERWPESTVSDDLRQRHQDRVWRVRRRNRWLYVLVLLEFRSTVDHIMPAPECLCRGAVRILAYTALLYQDLLRTSTDPLPPVLAVVLHHGREQWTAPEDMAGLAAPPGAFLAPCQPAQRYFLLDVGGYTGSLPEGRNLMAGLIRLEHSRSPEEVEAVLAALAEWLSEPEHEGLRRAFGEWMRQVHVPARRLGREWPEPEDWNEDGTMLYETVKEWTVQWRAEGQAEVMRRQAARKFGGVTANRLAEELERIHDPERVVEIGEWLVECESGEELLHRVRRACMAAAPPDGDEAASP